MIVCLSFLQSIQLLKKERTFFFLIINMFIVSIENGCLVRISNSINGYIQVDSAIMSQTILCLFTI